MKFLWLTWKDYTHPQAGGAEVVLRELSQRLVAEGHEVTFLTAQHPGSKAHDTLDGIEVIRVGTNRYFHPFQALAYYLSRLRNKYDVVIEVINVAPYFSAWFKGQSQVHVLYHQLSRRNWFYEAPPVMSHFGHYILEPAATWLMAKARAPLITVSESTKKDLARYGWCHDNTRIISEGIELEPVASLDKVKKFKRPTVLSLGAFRSMKRTYDQIKAFEIAKQKISDLQMKIAGSSAGAYGPVVLKAIEQSPFASEIEYLGKVSLNKKLELMRRSHAITVTSVKEGWGLIVTEAASQGTPAVVYDVDGLRDSVRHAKTGLVTPESPADLADGIVNLLSDQTRYASFQKNAWEWSQAITFDKSYEDFKQAVGLA
jgi:glycosyltransferase involved in cell wall biosynthesis